ncbi:UbiA family prenyltransferase [Streptomyces sp. NPDC047108]|uniref:UbiA family prenyltransferase n=1 Tax=Streptomyces sp. NPDC047108 TaxID=3155025 RepID=UPI0033EA394B
MASDDLRIHDVPSPDVARSRPVRGALRRAAALSAACHPVPAAAVTVMATGLAVSAGQSGAGCALVAGAVAAGQLSVGWSNDAIDAARDAAAGRSAKPVASGAVPVRLVRNAALIALALCVPLSLACGPVAGAVHLAGVGAAWAYNLGLKATPWSPLPYAVGFASLPAFVVLSLPGSPWPPWWLMAAGALLGVGAHLADVLPDIGDDLEAGVRGWPQRLGPVRVRLLLPVPLVAASALLILAVPGAVGRTGTVLLLGVGAAVAGAALLGRTRPRVPFRAALGVAGLDVILLLWRGSGLS